MIGLRRPDAAVDSGVEMIVATMTDKEENKVGMVTILTVTTLLGPAEHNIKDLAGPVRQDNHVVEWEEKIGAGEKEKME